MSQPNQRVFTISARADAPDDGLAHYRMTTEIVDGHDSVFYVAGCVLDRFRANPVILLDHENSVRAIAGRAERIDIVTEGGVGSIDLAIRFAETEHADDAGSLAARLHRAGFLRAMSQSFNPLKARMGADITDAEKARFPTLSRWGMIFDEWELREASFVGLGSNPGALKRAHEEGLLTKGDLRRLTGRTKRGRAADAPVPVTVDNAALLARIGEVSERVLSRLDEMQDALAAVAQENHLAVSALVSSLRAAGKEETVSVETDRALRDLERIATDILAKARGGASDQNGDRRNGA